MSKKNSILIIFAVAILVIGGILYFYFSNQNNSSTNFSASSTNPFGDTSGYNNSYNSNATQTNNTEQNTENIYTSEEKLIHLYTNPTSGSIFIKNKDNKNVFRFVDRAVGNVYEYIIDETSTLNRITNTTIPKIQEAILSSNGTNLILRYLDDDSDNINSFSGKIIVASSSSSTDSSIGKIEGNFLTSNINQLVMSPKGDKIFNLIERSDKSGTYGFTTDLSDKNKKTIFDSAISYWNISWPKSNIITFTTKPNYTDSGMLFFFNTDTYSMDRILSGITGLSTLTNKDASLVAYSYKTNNAFGLNIYDVKNKISKNYNISTLADKCVWGSSDSKILYCAIPQSITAGDYPDIWYQGLTSFNDDIWKINTDDGSMTILYQLNSDNISVDAYDLKISLDDSYLSFANKNDLSLWLLKI